MGKHIKLMKAATLNGTVRTAAQTAVLMAILTLCSKLLGFIREMIIANYFGASYIVDAYVMSTALPGILFGGVFAAVATAYMPLYSKINEEQGEVNSNRFTSEVINLLILVSVFASIIGII
ncbi:MAG TPA: lipid II flippase MurJ, partial [Anaerovoracaceae bacterium]|nr:lipid II flippase MurJ [Anaerovoracaceae bacterium]